MCIRDRNSEKRLLEQQERIKSLENELKVYAALKRIADYYPQIYGIIFCRTRKETQEIADKLIQDAENWICAMLLFPSVKDISWFQYAILGRR